MERREEADTPPSRRNWRYCSLLFLFSKAESRKEKIDESKNENSRKKKNTTRQLVCGRVLRIKPERNSTVYASHPEVSKWKERECEIDGNGLAKTHHRRGDRAIRGKWER